MASQPLVWLITGASRGIGLELTKQLLDAPSHFVVAACRNPSSASGLKALAVTANDRLHTVRMDVSDASSIRSCADEVCTILGDRRVGVDYLVNNAGVALRPDTAYGMDVDDMLQTFVTNVAGPVLSFESRA
ncbi:NAD(P)-binding protein [Polyporus arcularius HHB13444]|uniref:NAD(P)-binding protein n=1 Tax=Polyporus arcularius HHB13444 TaxID=1314778 RepID=A0A5C3PFC9_9APHY|nr:NAD(P)-binding protein [Polyporus arcularius HHB13444]